MNWDDLRVVRAVFRSGSYSAAARALGVNPTTVPRRLARLERDLRVTLFEAVDGGRRATPQCREILAISESIAEQVQSIEQVGDGTDLPAERRRIAATDSMSACLFAPRLPSFLAENPGIAVDLLASTENIDFSRWQADVAVRLRRPEKGDFVLARLTDFDLYFCEPAAADGDLVVCAYPEDLDHTPESRFLMKRGLQNRARCRTKNVLVTTRLLASGRCAAVLPSWVCSDLHDDASLRLTRLPEKRSAWLLIQRHLKDDPATRLLVDWIRECAASV